MFNMSTKELILNKFVPSILCFIAGFIIMRIITGNFESSLAAGFILGGFLWGWSITKKWFPNFSFTLSTFGGVMDMVGGAIRITAALVVGVVALPIGIVITIISAISVGKEKADEANEQLNSENSEHKNE